MYLQTLSFTMIVFSADFHNKEGITNLTKVSKEDFEHCNVTNPFQVWYRRCMFALNCSSMHYITSIYQELCNKGQKLAIYVSFNSSDLL